MNPQQGLIALAQGFLAYVVVAGLYVAGSYVIAQKLGTRILPALWLVTSLVVGGLALRRVYLPYRASDPIHWDQLIIAIGLCVMFFLAFGLATLSVRARLRREPKARLFFLVSDVRRLSP